MAEPYGDHHDLRLASPTVGARCMHLPRQGGRPVRFAFIDDSARSGICPPS